MQNRPRDTNLTIGVAAVFLAFSTAAAFGQQPAPAPAQPAATPKPKEEPRWLQGRPPEMANSPLAPIAPHLTGRPAAELPIDKLKVPPGFKVEVWVDGVPEARSLALGEEVDAVARDPQEPGAEAAQVAGAQIRDRVQRLDDRLLEHVFGLDARAQRASRDRADRLDELAAQTLDERAQR